MIDLNVPFLPQTFEFDCWYASLRMLVKFRHGMLAEPVGHPRAEIEGMQQQSIRTAVVEDVQRQAEDGQSELQTLVQIRNRLYGIHSRGLRQGEFQELAGYNGLCAPVLPPYDRHHRTGGFTSNQLECLMRIHGPLWCAFSYFHIVVAKGVDAHGNVIVHDPQGSADTLYPIDRFNYLLTWRTNCVMFLPGLPNPGAFRSFP